MLKKKLLILPFIFSSFTLSAYTQEEIDRKFLEFKNEIEQNFLNKREGSIFKQSITSENEEGNKVIGDYFDTSEGVSGGRSEDSFALGNKNHIFGKNVFSFGMGNKIGRISQNNFDIDKRSKYTTVIGLNNQIIGNNSVIIGNNVKVNLENEERAGHDVYVLGSNITLRDIKDSIVLGNNSVGMANALSVGNSNNLRKIVFVKDGEINANSTDVITGKQLYNPGDINVNAWKNKLGIITSSAPSDPGQPQFELLNQKTNNNVWNDTSNDSFAVGWGNNITLKDNNRSNISYLFGKENSSSGDQNFILGYRNTLSGNYNSILGSNISANNVTEAIILGNGSTGVSNALSIGNENNKRKIVYLKEGEITSNSSDAITGGQIYSIKEELNGAIEGKLDKTLSNLGNISDTARDNLTSSLGIGEVVENNSNLVTGGTVFKEVDKKLDKTAFDTFKTDELAPIKEKVESNATEIGKLKDKKADKDSVYTKEATDTKLETKLDKTAFDTFKTEIEEKVESNITEIGDLKDKKADKDSVYTKEQIDTKLETKLDKTQFDTFKTEIKEKSESNATEIGKLKDKKADKDSVYTKEATDTKLETKLDKTAFDTFKTEIEEKVESNTTEIGDLKDKKADKDSVYTKKATDEIFVKKSELEISNGNIQAIKEKLDEKADKNNVYTKEATDTKLETKLDKTDITKHSIVGDGIISVKGNGKVLDDTVNLAINDNSITKEKLSIEVKNEIDSKVNVDASNIKNEDIDKWRNKLGILENGNIVSNPNGVSYSDSSQTLIELGKDGKNTRISNLDTPIHKYDAVNKEYVDNIKYDLTGKIDDLRKYSAISSAVSNIPNVITNEKVAFGVGVSSVGGKKGVALGLGGTSGDKLIGYKASLGLSEGKVALGAGFSINISHKNKDKLREDNVESTNNNELIELRKKYEKLERENEELKKKIDYLFEMMK